MEVASQIRVREQVREAYSQAARDPGATHPFPVGRAFAESLGYPPELIERIPGTAVEAFTGVSNVSVFAALEPGMHVLDLGCGAGLDALLASCRVGSAGRVTGVDFSEPMLRRAVQAVREAGCENVLLCRAGAEQLPLPDHSVDVALVNGLFNLNPAREHIFRELARVLRLGGKVYAAELILSEPLPPERLTASDWFA